MTSKPERHVRTGELPRGVRRCSVQLAIAMTWLSFCAFLVFVACWAGRVAGPTDTQAAATLGLIGAAVGTGHGIHARLKLQNAESREFTSQPGLFDFAALALSVFLLIAGCCVGAGLAR